MQIDESNFERIEKLLYSYRDFYGRYHDQKDRLVWSTLAIYVSISSAVLGFAHNSVFKVSDAILFSIFFLLLGSFVKKFIKTQLETKMIGANTVNACNKLINQLLSGKLTKFDFTSDHEDGVGQFPKTITDEILEARRSTRYMKFSSDIITFSVRLIASLRQEKIENFAFGIFWISQAITILVWWKGILIATI